jgi:hypothetical protein
MNEDYKKYTLQARTGIKGEAFFEALIADYALPHQIVGPKDIGIDYICEWVFGDKPTGILFGTQVKTFSIASATPQPDGVESTLNGLERFRIDNRNLTIDEKTLRYWKGLGLPMYLFAVVNTPAVDGVDDRLDCYYKRFTSVLTSTETQEQLVFYKANRGAKFRAFANDSNQQGFARDLFIDYMRWAYYKGTIAYLNPRTLGLNQFPQENMVFDDLLGEYRQQVCETYLKTKQFLDEYCARRTSE